MKILSVVGARPQFVKAAPVSAALRSAGLHEVLVHTGQHYDREMSQLFFDEMGIPEPDHKLGVGSGSHGRQTGEMLIAPERVIQQERPDWVLVLGDTGLSLCRRGATTNLSARTSGRLVGSPQLSASAPGILLVSRIREAP